MATTTPQPTLRQAVLAHHRAELGHYRHMAEAHLVKTGCMPLHEMYGRLYHERADIIKRLTGVEVREA